MLEFGQTTGDLFSLKHHSNFMEKWRKILLRGETVWFKEILLGKGTCEWSNYMYKVNSGYNEYKDIKKVFNMYALFFFLTSRNEICFLTFVTLSKSSVLWTAAIWHRDVNISNPSFTMTYTSLPFVSTWHISELLWYHTANNWTFQLKALF